MTPGRLCDRRAILRDEPARRRYEIDAQSLFQQLIDTDAEKVELVARTIIQPRFTPSQCDAAVEMAS